MHTGAIALAAGVGGAIIAKVTPLPQAIAGIRSSWSVISSSNCEDFGLNRLAAYVARYKWRYIIGFVLLIAASFLVMVPPIVVRDAIDSIDGGTTSSHLAEFAGLLIGLAFIEGTVRFVGRTLISGTSRHTSPSSRVCVRKRSAPAGRARPSSRVGTNAPDSS